jgi:hypothetical protein
MTVRVTVAVCAAAGVAAALVAVALIARLPRPARRTSLTGAVLRQDADPKKQVPIPDVRITAADGDAVAEARSDSAGLFRLNLLTGIWRGAAVNLTFTHPEYQPLNMASPFGGRLYVIRMQPLPDESRAAPAAPETVVTHVRVRYAVKAISTVTVGSMVKTFEVINKGNVPCEDRKPCSPDGKWKAVIDTEALDAGAGQEFRNARLSCIAGPCPFTRVESADLSGGSRVIHGSVRNWSDTVTFLWEAEVIRTMPSDAIRQSYPAIFGRTMNFTLPPGAQGPSIEAEMNGQQIVFPLGPTLTLSWAVCNRQNERDNTKLYSCQLKAGFRFQ